MKRFLIILWMMIVSAHMCMAQITPVVSSSKDKILIGEPLKLRFEVKAIDPSAKIIWNFPDSIAHFEYVQFDTTNNLQRDITITSWDSGAWQLQGVSITVPSNLNGKPQILEFEPKEIMVAYDTTGSAILNDIKPIIEVNGFEEPWIAYSIIAAAVISLLLLIYLFKKWKSKKPIAENFEPALGAYEEFAKTIKALQEKNWSTQHEQKTSFSELTTAAKRFLERNYRQPFSKYTTDETIFHLAPLAGKDTASQLTQVLRLADAIKFARFAAPEQECKNALAQTATIIQQIHQLNRA
jgi:hypothetical protein